MRLEYNRNMILNMVKEKPGIGKTAVMKFVFFLQRAYRLKLGYPFGLYTYGPYSSDVSEDLDSLVLHDLLKAKTHDYGHAYGYRFYLTQKGEGALGELTDEETRKLRS